MMDALAQAWFETRFELLFLKARGDDFQRLLGRAMSMAYPGDFVQTRPWGNLGDEKCDGYLRSQRRFFQCYLRVDSHDCIGKTRAAPIGTRNRSEY